jgi:hypothetical protein
MTLTCTTRDLVNIFRSMQVLLYGSLYHDAGSGDFHTHHNVVVGGPMWLYLQWGTMGPGC